MTRREPTLEAVLASLRDCHDPLPVDRRRVRRALAESLMEAGACALRGDRSQTADDSASVRVAGWSVPARHVVPPARVLAGVEENSCLEEPRQEISGVHSRPGTLATGADRVLQRGAPWARRRQLGPQLLVGVVVLAAAAAIAVVAFARPGAFGATRVLVGRAPELEATPAGPAGDEISRVAVAVRQPTSGSTASALVSDRFEASDGGCAQWPCWQGTPARSWSLAGTELEFTPAPEAPAVVNSVPEPRALLPAQGPSDEPPTLEKRAQRLELLPTLALDLGRDRASPGVGARVAVPVTRARDWELEATALTFGSDAEHHSRLALGTGLCWNPMLGQVDVALCGQLGYEQARSGGKSEAQWLVSGGVGAHAVWKPSRSAGVYLAVQTAVPIAGSSSREGAHFLRVVAGPEFRF